MGLFNFKPAWIGANREKELKAVAETTSEIKLLKIAKESFCYDVRIAAVMKLNDEKMLADAAMSDLVGKIRAVAIERITDQNLLSDIASADLGEEISKYVRSLNKFSTNARANAAAIRMFQKTEGSNDQSLVPCTFRNHKDIFVKACLSAADKLSLSVGC
jgi:hypothetical protein